MPMPLVLIIVCERDALKSLRGRFVLMAWRDFLVRWWMIWWRDHKPIRWALKQCHISWNISGCCCCCLCRYLQFSSAAMVVKSSRRHRRLVDDGMPFVLPASHWTTTTTTVCGAHCVDNKWSEITRERMAMFSWLLLICEINLFLWMGSLAGWWFIVTIRLSVGLVCVSPRISLMIYDRRKFRGRIDTYQLHERGWSVGEATL